MLQTRVRSLQKKGCAKRCLRKNHLDEIETSSHPSVKKAKEHSTERITGAELRKTYSLQNPVPKDNPQAPAKSFFLPGDAFAQLRNLVSYMAFTGVSEALDGSPGGFENEADWATSSDEPEPQDDIRTETSRLCWFDRGARSWLTDTGAQQSLVGTSAAQWWCERLTRPGARGCDTGQHDRHLWWNRVSQGDTSSGFPCWNVDMNGVMRFLVLEESVSNDAKQQFIPPLAPVTLMRQRSANIRMKESGDVLEIEDTENLITKRSGTCAQSAGFLLERWLDFTNRLACSAQI